jgi:hypothetical protein
MRIVQRTGFTEAELRNGSHLTIADGIPLSHGLLHGANDWARLSSGLPEGEEAAPEALSIRPVSWASDRAA